jgi:hypothetical protein
MSFAFNLSPEEMEYYDEVNDHKEENSITEED